MSTPNRNDPPPPPMADRWPAGYSCRGYDGERVARFDDYLPVLGVKQGQLRGSNRPVARSSRLTSSRIEMRPTRADRARSSSRLSYLTRMRILFLVHVLGRTRHFKNVISGLVDRGHTVVLAPASSTESERPRKGLYDHERVEVVACPTRRQDRWAPVMEPLRRSRDHLRFFDPRYSHAVKLAERAAESAPQTWKDALSRHPWMTRHWKTVQRALELAEAVVPCDPDFQRFMEAQQPDLVLVTPLVEFGSYQTEYV